MRIISMVPSWTETLLECGENIVGRTRFCVHPKETVESIPCVGGTKDIDWEKIKSLNADFLVLDAEENPKKFLEDSPIPCIATHIENVANVATALRNLNAHLKNPKIAA